MKIASVALDTTSLNPWESSAGIVRVSLAIHERGVEQFSISMLVNPGVSIGNSEFHGVTDDQVDGADGWGRVSGLLDCWLDGVERILCHTERFQRTHWIAQSSKWSGAPASWWFEDVVDVQDLARAVTKQGKYASGYDVDSLVDRLDVNPCGSKAQKVLAIYNKLTSYTKDRDVHEIIQEWNEAQDAD